MFAENFHRHDTNMNMNMPSRLTAILLLTAVSALCASASSRDLKGKVTDPSGAPVESALVVLMSGTDSTVMDFTYADTSGFFSLDDVSGGSFVEVSFIGFEKVLRPVTGDFLTIVLEPSVERLDEVTVTASRGLVDRRPGRLVYSPPAEVAAAVNAYTILGYTPLVTVNRENISVVGGKSAEIWIDGRKPVMGQEAAMDILRNTSADKIEKIEVVTSPGASFRAAAGKAVINIVYKKEPGRGFDGSASVEGIYQFNKVSPQASLNYSYASPTRSLTWEIPDRHQLGLSFSKQFGFGGTISIDAVDILGSFGPRFFSTDSYSYRRNLRTYPGIFILTYRQTFGDKFVRKASNRSAGGLQGRIKGE